MDENNSSTATEAQDNSKKFSILTELTDCKLHRKSPFGIANVSHTQFSIARYYGMINFNGYRYIYYPDTDELIREDVMRWKAKQLKAKHTQQNDLQKDLTL
jgi:hypothetical protein